MAANLLRQWAHAAANEKRAGSFRRINLVRRQREQIAAERVDINRKTSGCLHCVSMKPEMTTPTLALRAHQRANLRDRLNRADLVISHHYADQHRVGTNRCAHIFKSHESVVVNRQTSHVPTAF